MARAVSSTGGAGPRRATATDGRALRTRGQRTMRKLLDAGADVFAAKGYHETRVDDIVKVAETSHGTFYLYFSNKEDLFRALATEVANEMGALAESLGPLQPGAAGLATLQEWVGRLAELYDRYGSVIRAWTEAEIGRSEFGRLATDVLSQFTRACNRRIGEVAPPGLDPPIASLALVAMLERLNYYALTQQVRIDHDAMVETLARVMHNALFGSAG